HETSLIYSPNGKWLATASHDSTIILWDSDGGQPLYEWVPHGGSVKSLAFSPDSRYVVSAGIWKNSLCELTLIITIQIISSILASMGENRSLAIWDVSRGARKVATLEGHTKEVTSCARSPDGALIASVSSREANVRLWDPRTYRLLHLRIAEQSTCLATGRDSGRVRIWDIQTEEYLFTLDRHTDEVLDLAFSPDGTSLLSASKDKTVKIWDASSGAVILSLKGHTKGITAACFSPCGKYVASASRDKKVRLWKRDDGSCVETFSKHEACVRHVAFSPDGEILSYGVDDGTV
ncbi:WD40 repeat-like protein, partial [Dichomitus squalens LYAD-421 SS1]